MTSRSIHRFLQHLIKPAASRAPPTTLPRLHTPRWPPWQPSEYFNTFSEKAQASRPRRGVGLVAASRVPPTTHHHIHTPRWPPWQPLAYFNTSSEEAQASRPRRGVGLVAELRHMLMVPDTYLKMSSLQNEEEKVDLIVKIAESNMHGRKLSTLKERLSLLVSQGFDAVQISECPHILSMNPRTIQIRVARLKALGCAKITPTLLWSAKEQNEKTLLDSAREYFEALGTCASHREFVAQILNYDPMDLNATQVPLDIVDLKKKVELFLSAGYSINEIRDNRLVLNKAYSKLKTQVDKMIEYDVRDKMPFHRFAQSSTRTDVILRSARNEKEALDGHNDRYEAAAALLGVPVEKVRKEFDYVEAYNWTRTKAIVSWLLENGYSPEDIMDNSFIIMHTLNRIKKGHQKMLEREFKEIDVGLLFKCMTDSLGSYRVSSRKGLVKLLECSVHDLDPFKDYLKTILQQPLYKLRDNVRLLQKAGFFLEDIRRLPLVLAHEPTILARYLASLESREELQPVDEWKRSPLQLLNALQYFIERDLNFSSIAAYEEEEIQGLTETKFFEKNDDEDELLSINE